MSLRAGLCLAALMVAGFEAGCGRIGAHAQGPSPAGPERNTGHAAGGAYLHDFRVPKTVNEEGMPEGMWVSDYDFANDFANVHWLPQNISFDREGMRITVKRERRGGATNTSGEIQVSGFYGYGRYEVVMRAARGSGLDTAFFLHTYNGLDSDPHDEIDFEFVGKQPGQVQLNYFRAGRPYGSFGVDLGYDASAEIHLYAFEWTPESIRWYVDGRLLAEKVRPPELQIPFTTQRPIMNLLPGGPGMQDWVGEPTFESGASALYVCTSHVPLGETGRQCSDLPDRAGAPPQAPR
jgi:beta-glucanase (GH16 family)